jgi:CRP-like cAMP-binding protein
MVALVPFALPIRDCQRCPLGAACLPAACPWTVEQRSEGRHVAFNGAAVERVSFVKRGYVALHARRGTLQALRGPGALLGVECLSPRAHAHTITALTPVELCTLAADDFRAFALAKSAVTMSLLSQELRNRDLDETFRSGAAAARLARFLLARLEQGGGSYPVPFTQETLARLLDLRPETLSRVLKRMRDDGAIGERLFVRDPAALVALSRGTPQRAIIPRT